MKTKGEKPQWRRLTKVKALVGVVSLLVSVMLWQLPVETVYAEGTGDAPKFLMTLDTMKITNITFQLVNAEIGFILNNETFTFNIDSATVTIVEVVLDVSEDDAVPLPPPKPLGARHIMIFMDIQGVTIDTPDLKLTLNTLFLELNFTLYGNQSVFKVIGTTYVPVYRLIETAVRH